VRRALRRESIRVQHRRPAPRAPDLVGRHIEPQGRRDFVLGEGAPDAPALLSRARDENRPLREAEARDHRTGLCARERVARVALVGARQRRAVLSPAVVHHRALLELAARAQQAQEEIVVLGEDAVPVAAEPLEGRAPKGRRGVAHGLLDPDLAAVLGRRQHRVLPRDVRAHARPGVLERKGFRATRHRVERGRPRERGDVGGETIRVHSIVGVHARDEVRAASTQADVERVCERLAAGARDHAHALIHRETRRRVVDAAVIDGDHLELHVTAREHARERLVHRRRGVAARHQNRDDGSHVRLTGAARSPARRT
jgi:hypothetical protein